MKITELYTVNRSMRRPIKLEEGEGGEIRPYLPGERLEDVVDVVIQLAREQKRTRTLVFNSVSLEITGKDSVEVVTDRFHAELNRQHEVWRNSPEGKKAAAERAAQIQKRQTAADRLAAELPQLQPGDHRAALQWAAELSEAADDVAVRINHSDLIDGVVALGYRANENTDTGLSDQARGLLLEKLHNDPAEMARYIMGQVLDNLGRKMGPHPVVIRFVEEWMVRNG